MSAEYKRGDRVTLEHPDGSRLVREVVTYFGESAAIEFWEGRGFWRIRELEGIGWKVTSHTPAVTLPTMDGVYLSPKGRLFTLNEGKWLLGGAGSLYRGETPIDDGPLTRLAPVSESAREVIEHMDAHTKYSDSWSDIFAEARAVFGVEVTS